MSYEALDWWHTHAHRYVDLRTEPELWVLADVLARHTDRDPREGAWPSQARLGEVLGGVKAETVARYIARLEATGVIKVVPRGGPQVPGKPGRRPHLYLFPEIIAAHGLPPTSPHGVGGNPGEDPSGVTSDASARDRRQTGGVTSDPRGGYLRSQRGVTSDRHAHDGGGRGKAIEGKEKAANAAPLPPAFPDQCSKHQDDYNDAPCRGCKRQRESNEANAAVAEGAEQHAKRLAREIIDRALQRQQDRSWEGIRVPTWTEALAQARRLVEQP